MRKFLFLAIMILFVFLAPAKASTTGKIAGTITDKKTGEPLIGVNVLLEGTSFGAATNLEGYYVILNVPPGSYNMKATYIGYQSSKIVGIRINIDQTTIVDVQLDEENIQMGEVIIVASAPVVQQDVSSSRANISAAEIEVLPTTDANRAISLQAGIQFGADGPIIRGGAANQTAYIVNGLTLRDERDNTPYTTLSLTAVEDIQVQTGGFNAEFGNIRSGIVNVVTKEGSKDKYTFSLVTRYRPAGPKNFGGSVHSPDSYWIRPYIDDAVAWTGTKNGSWNEFTQKQYQEFEGWLSVSEKLLNDDDPNNDLSPRAAQELFLWQHRRNLDIKKPDYEVDMSFGGPVPVIGKDLGNLRFFASYRREREMYLIPLSTDSYQDYAATLKLTADLGEGKKLMFDGLYGEQSGTNNNNSGLPGIFRSNSSIASSLTSVSYIDARIFGTDYWAPTNVLRMSTGLKFTHVLNPTTFYEAIISRFASDYNTNPGRRRNDTTYIARFGNNYWVDESPFGWQEAPSTGIGSGMRMGVGMSNSRDSSFIAVYTAKFDITSQLNKYNQVKAGFEINYTDNRTNYASVDKFLQSGRSQSKWETTPIRGGLYVQDKLEFEGMIANVGVRIDYLDPSGEWYVYDPFNNAFSSRNSLGIDTLLPKEATAKQLTVSPRIGIAFPITVDSKLFFNYGHQRSIPTPENLYLLRRYSDNNAVTRLANPNNPLEKTIQYELGYEHNLFDQFLLRLAGYYKDVSQQPALVTFTNRDNSVNYSVSQPNSYADIRGFEFTLTKNRGNWVQGFVNYTYQVTTSGRFGFAQYYENLAAQRQYEREARDQYQEKPVPRPFARANVNFFTPSDYGPVYEGLFPLADWRLTLLGEWTSGYYLTWTGGGSIPGIINNVQWNDYFNVDLRLSKAFKFGSLNLEFFMDVSNLLNYKYMTQYGFIDGKDYEAYMKSLHLPAEIGDPLKYGNIPGEDRPGDYRIRGEFTPMLSSPTTTEITTPSTAAIYYISQSGKYMQYKNDAWVQVDQGRIDDILDNKQYIDMPNQNYFTFLGLRDINWGLKLSFELR